MREGHISRAFDGALAALHVRVLEMGGLVHEQVREAARAFTEWSPEAAQCVIERQAKVATYDAGIYQDHITLIARRQPVASDLRAIVAMARIVAELERTDHEAGKIARTVLQQSGRPSRNTSADVRHLAQLATGLLRTALEALDRIEAGLAEQVIAQDEELDAEYAAGLRRLLTRAMEDPRALQPVIESAFVLKSLEHIGDHGRNVAQQVLILATESQPRNGASSATSPGAGPSTGAGDAPPSTQTAECQPPQSRG
jgi:phosphate transport system protein